MEGNGTIYSKQGILRIGVMSQPEKKQLNSTLDSGNQVTIFCSHTTSGVKTSQIEISQKSREMPLT